MKRRANVRMDPELMEAMDMALPFIPQDFHDDDCEGF